jgi:hypothetical protein
VLVVKLAAGRAGYAGYGVGLAMLGEGAMSVVAIAAE